MKAPTVANRRSTTISASGEMSPIVAEPYREATVGDFGNSKSGMTGIKGAHAATPITEHPPETSLLTANSFPEGR